MRRRSPSEATVGACGTPSLEPFDDASKTAREAGLAVLRPTDAQLQHGLELHRASLVIDGFGFAPYIDPPDLVEQYQAAIAGNNPAALSNTLINEMRELSCVRFDECRRKYFRAFDAAGVAAHVQTSGGGEGVVSTLCTSVARFIHLCDQMPGQLKRARSASDVRRAYDRGEHAMILSINGPVLGVPGDQHATDLSVLRIFRHLGVRFMHLAYNIRNLVADGCVEDENCGLTDFGKTVVREMQRLGIIVDLSHCGYQSALDAAALADKPVVVTHAACRALNANDRCVPDEVIRAVADTGGYVGVAAVAPFLGPGATLGTFLDHIEHIVRLVGPDHAAVGTDRYSRYAGMPPEARKILDAARAATPPAPPSKPRWRPGDPVLNYDSRAEEERSLAWSNWPLITVGLVQRGYCDEDIRKILGQNILRVLESTGDQTAPPVRVH